MMSFNWNMLLTWKNVGKSVLGFVGCDFGHVIGRHWLIADGLEETAQNIMHYTSASTSAPLAYRPHLVLHLKALVPVLVHLLDMLTELVHWNGPQALILCRRTGVVANGTYVTCHMSQMYSAIYHKNMPQVVSAGKRPKPHLLHTVHQCH